MIINQQIEESDDELLDDLPRGSTTSRQPTMLATQPSVLQDSLLEEELEISQPLVVDTVPVQDVSPSTWRERRQCWWRSF